MATVDIIVPVYNVENYVTKCLDSILKQTFKDFNVYLIDDGSTDNSSKICDEFAKKDSRFKVFHIKNKGLSGARNEGLRHSTSEYIMFLDGDDELYDYSLSELYSLLIKSGADIAVGSLSRFDCDGKEHEYAQFMLDNIVLQGEDKFFYRIKKFIVSACGKIYKRCIFDNLYFKEGHCYEDAFIFPYCMERAYKVACTSLKVVKYNVRPGSITNSSYSEKQLQNLDAYFFTMIFYKEKGYKKTYHWTILCYLEVLKNNYRKVKNAKNVYYMEEIKKRFRVLMHSLSFKTKIIVFNIACIYFVKKIFRRKRKQ